jgi:hypothetical protein
MKLPRRYLLLVAGLVAGFLLLQACGGQGEETPIRTPTDIASPTPTATAAAHAGLRGRQRRR